MKYLRAQATVTHRTRGSKGNSVLTPSLDIELLICFSSHRLRLWSHRLTVYQAQCKSCVPLPPQCNLIAVEI